MPAARRRARSSATMARLWRRPLAWASESMKDAEADAVDAGGREGGEGFVGELAGGAFDGDFGVGVEVEMRAHGCEETGEEIGGEEAGGSAAKVDGVDAAGEIDTHLRGPGAGRGEIVGKAADVAGVFADGVDSRGEVAVGTL